MCLLQKLSIEWSYEVEFVFVLEKGLRNMRVELLGQLLEGTTLRSEALLTFVVHKGWTSKSQKKNAVSANGWCNFNSGC